MCASACARDVRGGRAGVQASHAGVRACGAGAGPRIQPPPQGRQPPSFKSRKLAYLKPTISLFAAMRARSRGRSWEAADSRSEAEEVNLWSRGLTLLNGLVLVRDRRPLIVLETRARGCTAGRKRAAADGERARCAVHSACSTRRSRVIADPSVAVSVSEKRKASRGERLLAMIVGHGRAESNAGGRWGAPRRGWRWLQQSVDQRRETVPMPPKRRTR